MFCIVKEKGTHKQRTVTCNREGSLIKK